MNASAELLATIRSKGYWRIVIRPVVYGREVLSVSECETLIEASRVELRGWDFPHTSRRQDDKSGHAPCGSHYEWWVDSGHHKEITRLYRSAQFIHLRAFWEDWLDPNWHGSLAKQVKPGEALAIGNGINQIAEIVAFTARLAKDEAFGKGVSIQIEVHNTKGRTLWADGDRVPFIEPRRTEAKEFSLIRELQTVALIGDPVDITLGLVIELFEHYGWSDAPKWSLKDNIKQYLSRHT
ncbi:MAG: hypothetical protein AB7I36_05865 [Rhodospirillaceae bacterium]